MPVKYYIAGLDQATRSVLVAEGFDHPALYAAGLSTRARDFRWVAGVPPVELSSPYLACTPLLDGAGRAAWEGAHARGGGVLRCICKIRHQGEHLACTVVLVLPRLGKRQGYGELIPLSDGVGVDVGRDDGRREVSEVLPGAAGTRRINDRREGAEQADCGRNLGRQDRVRDVGDGDRGYGGDVGGGEDGNKAIHGRTLVRRGNGEDDDSNYHYDRCATTSKTERLYNAIPPTSPSRAEIPRARGRELFEEDCAQIGPTYSTDDEHEGCLLLVTFDEPCKAVAPGQIVALYKDSICLGGGAILRAEGRCAPVEYLPPAPTDNRYT